MWAASANESINFSRAAPSIPQSQLQAYLRGKLRQDNCLAIEAKISMVCIIKSTPNVTNYLISE